MKDTKVILIGGFGTTDKYFSKIVHEFSTKGYDCTTYPFGTDIIRVARRLIDKEFRVIIIGFSAGALQIINNAELFDLLPQPVKLIAVDIPYCSPFFYNLVMFRFVRYLINWIQSHGVVRLLFSRFVSWFIDKQCPYCVNDKIIATPYSDWIHILNMCQLPKSLVACQNCKHDVHVITSIDSPYEEYNRYVSSTNNKLALSVLNLKSGNHHFMYYHASKVVELVLTLVLPTPDDQYDQKYNDTY